VIVKLASKFIIQYSGVVVYTRCNDNKVVVTIIAYLVVCCIGFCLAETRVV
jgi:hypothetical protein